VNTREILKTVAHRPFPLPDAPWIMTQAWHHLLFAHWPISPQVLSTLVPPALTLDRFDGQCWVGIIPFYMTHLSPRGVPPLPYLSQSWEINVRTYVLVEDIPGMYFFSLDASNPLAVWLARTFFRLPYFTARIRINAEGDSLHYESQRRHPHAPSGAFSATYRPASQVYQAQRGTLDYWLTERYCLYTVGKKGSVFRAVIHHRAWPLQRVEAEIMDTSLASADGLHLPDTLPLLHYARKQEMLVWPLRRVT
jgi:uncharacterized protein YqjF (DUF2071 family)